MGATAVLVCIVSLVPGYRAAARKLTVFGSDVIDSVEVREFGTGVTPAAGQRGETGE